jgi:hypothetical protein
MGTHYYLVPTATLEEEKTLYKYGFELPKIDIGKDIPNYAFSFYSIEGHKNIPGLPGTFVQDINPKGDINSQKELWEFITKLVEQGTHSIQDEYEGVFSISKFKALIESKQHLTEYRNEFYNCFTN